MQEHKEFQQRGPRNTSHNMEEIILELPKHFVERSAGFSFDVGNSAMKVVYRHKDDWEECLQQKGETKAKVRLRIFPIENIKEAIIFLKENCHISTNENITNPVYATGSSSTFLQAEMLNVLGVKVETLWELFLFVKGFQMLSNHLTMEQFEYIPGEDFKAELRQTAEIGKMTLTNFYSTDIRNVYKAGRLPNPDQEPSTGNASSASTLSKIKNIRMKFCDSSSVDPITKTIPDMFPCLLYIISSGSIIMMLKGEDDFQYITPIKNGGRIFLGQGALICGTKKTYDELIDMAERGDNRNVDSTKGSVLTGKRISTELKELHSDPNSEFLDEIFFSFGEVAKSGLDCFKKEDLIRSLLLCTIRYHVDSMYSTLVASGARHIFVVGSFTNRELVRKMMYKEFARHTVYVASTYGSPDSQYFIHFVKTAGYLGAIGAFMQSGASPES